MFILLFLPATIMAVLAWVCYQSHPVGRLFTVAVVFGIGYWYVMPGAVFLLDPGIQGMDSYLLSSGDATLHSVWLINFSLGLLLLLPCIVIGKIRLRYATLQREILNFSGRNLDRVLYITVLSSGSLLVMRFAELGPAFALQLIVGLTSAREVMTFENISGDIGQSLIGLWELLTVFASIFLATTYVWLRRTMSMRFVLACLATVLVFSSNGTRSVLLLLLFSLTTTVITRPPLLTPTLGQASRRLRLRPMLPVLLLMGLCILAGVNMSARFINDPSQAEHIFLNSVASHNDMFRELLYSLIYSNVYQANGWLLLQTPFTFAMPSFLGFSKTIPPHLVDFNYDRAGIDLLGGAGNVFPGLIADMYLCFGEFGPLMQAVLSGLFLFLLWQVTLKINKSAIGGALFVTLLAYYVISFRNLQGSFGILLIAAFFFSRILSVRNHRRK